MSRAVIVAVVLALQGCVVPTPGVVYWEFCIAYGPQPEIIERYADGTVIKKLDQDSNDAIRQTMHACRD